MSDLTKRAQDAAYTAIGVGILGAQQIAQLGEQVFDAATSQLGAAREKVSGRLEVLVTDVRERVTDVRDRVEPLVDRVQATAESVVSTGTAKARSLLKRDEEQEAPAQQAA